MTPFDTKQAAEKEKSSPEIDESDKGDNSENNKGRPSSSNYDGEDPAKAALRNGDEDLARGILQSEINNANTRNPGRPQRAAKERAFDNMVEHKLQQLKEEIENEGEEQEADADEKQKTKRRMGKAPEGRSGKAKGKAKGRPKGKAGVGKKKKQRDDSEEESEEEDLHEQGKKEAAANTGALADQEAPGKEVVAPADDHADDETGPRRWRSDKAYMLLYKRKDLQFEYPTDLKKLIDARDAAQREEAEKILWNRVSNFSWTCESSLKCFWVFMI